MFGRLATDRIKIAEAALADDRLDEAADVLAGLDAGSLHKAGSVAQKVVAGLMQRGQEHMLSRRFHLAQADFDKAAQYAMDGDIVNEWRQRARSAIHEESRLRKTQEKALKGARDLMDGGQITQAHGTLADAPLDDAARKKLVAGIEQQRKEALEIVAEAREAIQNRQWDLAVEKINAGMRLHRQSPGLIELSAESAARLNESIREAFAAGQLHVARRQADLLASLVGRTGASADMDEALKVVHAAARAVHDDRFSEAEVFIGRLAGMRLDANWIHDAKKHLQSVQEHRRALLEGPLGLMSGDLVPNGLTLAPGLGSRKLPSSRPAPPPVIRAADEAGLQVGNGSIPRRFALRIDGVGTFLVLRGDRLSIGRAGANARADLELISDLGERHAEIIRAGEDFFIASSGGVELAGRPVEHALLQDGDRIRLGSRVKMKFHRPSAKSVTGVLELGDGVRTTCECRKVILWSGPLMLGNTRDCHIPLPHGMEGVVLMDRGGQIWMKPLSLKEPARPVVMNGPIVLGQLRMSVNKLEA